MSRVCFFGGYDPGYPRNRILRAGLAAAGVEVSECHAPPTWRAWRRFPSLAARFGDAARGADILLVAEFCHKDVPLARLLRGARKLVFDPFISREDTLVGDWRRHAPGSPQARWNRALDRAALGLADRVLCDTWAHGELYQELGVPRERLTRVLVGAESPFFGVPERTPQAQVTVLYVGGFLPLHGVPVLLEAVSRLEARAAGASYEVALAGSGMGHEQARMQAERLGLRTLRFLGPWPYPRLPELLAVADVVLGVFGAGEKAERVIPHKVYQGLAAGRAVLTGDSRALREVFEPGVHLAAAPRGDAGALAAGLERLIADAPLRGRLARAGRQRALEVATPEAIGRQLAEALFGATGARAGAAA